MSSICKESDRIQDQTIDAAELTRLTSPSRNWRTSDSSTRSRLSCTSSRQGSLKGRAVTCPLTKPSQPKTVSRAHTRGWERLQRQPSQLNQHQRPMGSPLQACSCQRLIEWPHQSSWCQRPTGWSQKRSSYLWPTRWPSKEFSCPRQPSSLPRDTQARGWWVGPASYMQGKYGLVHQVRASLWFWSGHFCSPSLPQRSDFGLLHWRSCHIWSLLAWGSPSDYGSLAWWSRIPSKPEWTGQEPRFKSKFCQVSANSSEGLQQPSDTTHHMFIKHWVTLSWAPELHLCTLSTSIQVMFA